MNMKKKYLYIISIIIPLLTSCEDWLNVNPKTEINSDILYQTENGFKSALAGIYTIMTETSLYGRETTFGLIGVLGMEWNVTTGQIASSTNEYYYAKNYDYENTLTKTKISNIWSKSYNAISNINKLIEYTETNREVLKDINYEVIRGEAFALRAYLHFDLLRMFASADFSSDIEYLPYSETSLPQVSVLRTPAEILEYVLTDLETAEELLINDPINATEEDVVDSYFRNRHFHMNYWAVKALKARVYLYSGNKEKALEESLAVIGSQETGLFQWVDPDDVSNTNANLRDRTFSSEHIFSLNNTKMQDQISGYFYDTTTQIGRASCRERVLRLV